MTNENKISGKQYTIYFNRDTANMDIDEVGVKFNHVDCDINTKTGMLQISAFFECKNIETAYRRFVKVFNRIESEVALLKGWLFMPAKKLTQNAYGWENENGDAIFNEHGDMQLSVDINEDTFYIFGNFSKAVEIDNADTDNNTATETKEETTMTITTKTAKNGATMYYVDGKRISREKAIEISKNADVDMLTNALGTNAELKNAQAILVIATKDPLEAGKDREFGWCFTNVIDAVEAAKKVAALFGDRFIKARIVGDATFDNKVIATVDTAGNVEIKKQTPEYIFTAYQIVMGVDCNGRTEHVEAFTTRCKEIGDDDNFTGLYREVTFYEDWHYNAWDIKTADGKLIAKGNTEAELKKAYEAIKAGNVEISEEIVEDKPAPEVNGKDPVNNIAQFEVGKTYCGYYYLEIDIGNIGERTCQLFHVDARSKCFVTVTDYYGKTKRFKVQVDSDGEYFYYPHLCTVYAKDAATAINASTDTPVEGSLVETDFIVKAKHDKPAETVSDINAHAPEGWEIRFDSEGKFFPVEFKGKTVAKLDSLATQKFLSPERFFEQFRPLADPNYTAKQQFIADRYNELSMLEEMREEIADDAEQLKTLEEMIEQVKRDIAAEEFAG